MCAYWGGRESSEHELWLAGCSQQLMRSTLLVWGHQWIQIDSEHVWNCQVRLVLYIHHPQNLTTVTEIVENLWALGTTLSDRGTHVALYGISRLNFSCYECEDETSLLLMPVVDETWVHSCDPDLVAVKWIVSQRITLPMNTLTGTGSAESHVHCGLQLWEYPSWRSSEYCYYKNF